MALVSWLYQKKSQPRKVTRRYGRTVPDPLHDEWQQSARRN
jgi:hypothetical protein